MLAELCRQAVLDAHAPAAVLRNARHDCLYSLGPTDRYLRVAPGHATADLLAMVDGPLRTRLRSALVQTAQGGARVTVPGRSTGRDGGSAPFSIDVQPLSSEGEALLLVCFADLPSQPEDGRAAGPGGRAAGYFLTAAKMRWSINHYLRGPADAADPLASPGLVDDCAGLPPALLFTAGLDPLLDEGLAYGERRRAAGVPVEHVNYEGWPHGFFFWAGTEAATDANRRIETALRQAFAADRPTAGEWRDTGQGPP